MINNTTKRLVTACKFLPAHLYKPSRHTYYPQRPQKSYAQICLDNLKWMIKHREINHYYYMYGLDIQNGNNPDCYFGKKEFNNIRNRANCCIRIGDQDTSYVSLLRDKFLFFQYLKVLGFPTPDVIALCHRDQVTRPDTKKVEPLSSLLDSEMDVFVKDLLGECAKGVFSLKTLNGDILIDGRKSDLRQLKMRMGPMSIIQKRIRQHPEISRLYSESVNTIRLLTVNNRHSIKPLAAILRIGAAGVRDNLTTGGVAVGIDIETGRLTAHGVMRPAFGRIVRRHPVSGISFEGFEIPFFKQAVELIGRLHKYFYGIKCVGWDVAITENGPVIVEGNDNWEVPTFQFFDPHFKQNLIENLT